jgi:hypothetical protein
VIHNLLKSKVLVFAKIKSNKNAKNCLDAVKSIFLYIENIFPQIKHNSNAF